MCSVFWKDNHVELLVNPVEMKFAVRTVAKSSRNAVVFSKLSDGKYQPRDIAGAAYVETLFQLFGWSPDLKYRIAGALFQTETESAYIFDVNDAEAFIKSYLLSGSKSTEQAKEPVQPLSVSGKRVRQSRRSGSALLASNITSTNSLSARLRSE